MANKLTKKDYFGMIREIAERENRTDLVEFVDHEIELLNKKRANGGMTATQKANEDVKANIIKALIDIARPVTISELQGENAGMAEFSNQKLSALLKQLVDANTVVRTVDKKKAYFSVAE